MLAMRHPVVIMMMDRIIYLEATIVIYVFITITLEIRTWKVLIY